jgi:hypothetical protein
MSIKTYLKGRLRNTSLPLAKGLSPLFEAAVNSIHSIEETSLAAEHGKITIEIIRSPQAGMEFDSRGPGREPTEPIIGFKITDNGIGFNDANMESFETLDSDYKAGKGCRGVGRLLWLLAFKSVRIKSIFEKDGEGLQQRTFKFGAESGVEQLELGGAPDGSERETTVHLDGFEKDYREKSAKTVEKIAQNLLEHCLWYFVRDGGAPKITIQDGDKRISLDDVYEEHMHQSAQNERIEIKGQKIDLTHIKLRSSSNPDHFVAYCADNRLVKEESIRGKIPGLFGKLNDDNGEFYYSCYVASSILDQNVRAERTGFVIEEISDDLLAPVQISMKDIQTAVLERAAEHLAAYLEENKRLGEERVQKFVDEKAPQYKPIIKHLPENERQVDPEISDKDLELRLHSKRSELERRVLSEGHNVLECKPNEDKRQYRSRLNEYFEGIKDLKQSDLAAYVFHRKLIIGLLEKAIERREDGSYAREDLIHKMIMPMQCESGDVEMDDSNLWLIDERLAFHNYLASDKTLKSMPITDSEETKEPDLCALRVYDNPILAAEGRQMPLASIVVVEIKRPMRNDAKAGEEKDPIEQALGYFRRIQKGEVTTAQGRPITHSDTMPGYCYVICDLTKSVRERCESKSFRETDDGLGYLFYHDVYNAWVEVISYDRLVNLAKQRNRAFFDKLGLPTT